jgi:hypothetical protein
MTLQLVRSRIAIYKPVKCKVTCIASKLKQADCSDVHGCFLAFRRPPSASVPWPQHNSRIAVTSIATQLLIPIPSKDVLTTIRDFPSVWNICEVFWTAGARVNIAALISAFRRQRNHLSEAIMALERLSLSVPRRRGKPRTVIHFK